MKDIKTYDFYQVHGGYNAMLAGIASSIAGAITTVALRGIVTGVKSKRKRSKKEKITSLLAIMHV